MIKNKVNYYLRLCLYLMIACQEKDPEPAATLPPTGCDGDLNGTDCQHFFIAAGETLSYPAGTTIRATEGIEINGNVVIDPANGGGFTLTATSGDIVMGGKILVKDTAGRNPSGGRYKDANNSAGVKNGKATDGFTLTLDAKGANGNIILKNGATLFSGRGQHAPDETLTSLSGYHEGAGGGNGGLIILNAPNGKIILPDLGNSVTSFQDELFVLGNGGNGAGVTLDANLEVGSLDVVEVRGGLGGNAGQLIMDALLIENIATLEAMETHPDYIYGGEGGHGGYVEWKWESYNSTTYYNLQEILFHGGDGGSGAKIGGDGGAAVFSPPSETFVQVGNRVPNAFCYGGLGGEVVATPLPVREVYGGDGGEYVVRGVTGWNGGEDEAGDLFRDGANGGNALGQGGNGGNILPGVKAYIAVGGSGGNSLEGRDFIQILLENTEYGITSSLFGVEGGTGGNGYAGCDGCPGGKGGDAGKATALGGKGGDVLGTSIQSLGGNGGDNWAVLRGTPGNGGDGNPGGLAGDYPAGLFVVATPGEGGNGTTPGPPGETLLYDPNADLVSSFDGAGCGEDLTCEADTVPEITPCTAIGATTTYYFKETKPVLASENIVTGEREYDDEIYTYHGRVTILARDPASNSVTSYEYYYSTTHKYKIGSELVGNVYISKDTTVTEEETRVENSAFNGIDGFIGDLVRRPQCDESGNLQWPGDGLFQRTWRYTGETRNRTQEWQLYGCVNFFQENNEIDRSHTQCCERSPGTPFPFQPCYKP